MSTSIYKVLKTKRFGAYCKLHLANYIKLLERLAFKFINFQLGFTFIRRLFNLFGKLYKTPANGCFLVYVLLIII